MNTNLIYVEVSITKYFLLWTVSSLSFYDLLFLLSKVSKQKNLISMAYIVGGFTEYCVIFEFVLCCYLLSAFIDSLTNYLLYYIYFLEQTKKAHLIMFYALVTSLIYKLVPYWYQKSWLINPYTKFCKTIIFPYFRSLKAKV